MRILITGGAGFIGSNVAKYHIENDDKVTVIDNLSTGKMDNIELLVNHPNFSFHNEDILTWTKLDELLANTDRVYHLAAVVGMFAVLDHPIETLKININATIRLFELILPLKIKPLVIMASSSEVYGDQLGELSEKSPLILQNSSKDHAAYSISKLGNESTAMTYFHKHHIPCVVLRIFNTIGVNQSDRYGMVVPRFIMQATHHQDITVFGDGTQTRSFCDVRDLTKLMDTLADHPNAIGEIVNIGHDQLISILELANLIKSLTHSHSRIVHIPYDIAYANEQLQINQRRPNLKKLHKLTAYQCQWSLKDTLMDLIHLVK